MRGPDQLTGPGHGVGSPHGRATNLPVGCCAARGPPKRWSSWRPLYLLRGALLSCGVAIGLTVLTWQGLLGEQVDWTVPVLAFVLLVAAGVDDTVLLISRIRRTSLGGPRRHRPQGIRATGVIFAGSLVAKLSASPAALAHTGFAFHQRSAWGRRGERLRKGAHRLLT